MTIEAVIEQLFIIKKKKNVKIHMPYFKGLGKHSKKGSYFAKEILPSKIRQLWHKSWEIVEANSSPNP